jgi:hypothetical protein
MTAARSAPRRSLRVVTSPAARSAPRRCRPGRNPQDTPGAIRTSGSQPARHVGEVQRIDVERIGIDREAMVVERGQREMHVGRPGADGRRNLGEDPARVPAAPAAVERVAVAQELGEGVADLDQLAVGVEPRVGAVERVVLVVERPARVAQGGTALPLPPATVVLLRGQDHRVPGCGRGEGGVAPVGARKPATRE